jgi:hypothetical protein
MPLPSRGVARSSLPRCCVRLGWCPPPARRRVGRAVGRGRLSGRNHPGPSGGPNQTQKNGDSEGVSSPLRADPSCPGSAGTVPVGKSAGSGPVTRTRRRQLPHGIAFKLSGMVPS